MRARRDAVNSVRRVSFERALHSVRRGGEQSPSAVDVVVFDGAVHDGWDIGGNANGGYLLALAGRAMAEVAGRPPLTVTGHYLAPAPAGPCTIEVRPVRVGRRMATMSASLRQGDRAIIEVLGTFADQTGEAGSLLVDGAPPDLPPYDECDLPPGADEGPLPAINDRLAVRLRPGDGGFRTGEPTGRAEIAGWFAFADGAPADAAIDAIGLLLVSDALAPAVFNTELPVGWVPTVELTVHVRGVPAPGPLRCRFTSRFIHGGLLEEDGEMWDSTGALVAQSRQLALTPRG